MEKVALDFITVYKRIKDKTPGRREKGEKLLEKRHGRRVRLGIPPC